MSVESTRQQLDPAGSLESRAIWVLAGLIGLAAAHVGSLLAIAETSDPVLAVAALACATFATAVVVVGTSASAAPFTRGRHLTVHVAMVLALALSLLSQGEANATVQNEWAPVTLGLLLVAIGPYRPAREIATLGCASAAIFSFLLLALAPVENAGVPSVIFAVGVSATLLALALGSASYAAHMVAVTIARRERLHERSEATGDSARSERSEILDLEVAPFLSELVANPRVTAENSRTAEALAARLRDVMVRDANRTWLARMLDHDSRFAIVDPTDVVRRLTTGQRTALRAFLAALSDLPGFSGAIVRLDEASRWGEVHATFDRKPSRHPLAPFAAVCGVVFSAFRVEGHFGGLAIQFSYGNRGERRSDDRSAGETVDR